MTVQLRKTRGLLLLARTSGFTFEEMSDELSKSVRSGFTLMELLVVLAVLALLAALIIPRIVGVTGQAQSATNANILAGINPPRRPVRAAADGVGRRPE